MSMLTRLVVLLVVLALLPFGSFNARFGTAPPVALVISAQLDDAAVAPNSTEKSFASAQSRCKGPALPGSPCNPALAVWPDAEALVFHAGATPLRPAPWQVRIGQTPPLLLDPPRLA